MWEIYTYDSWQSLTFGRPPSFALQHIDCGMAHETTKNSAGQIEMSFNAWKHRFSSQCLSIVHDHVFGAQTPSYKTLLDLDKKVREFYVPPSLQVSGFGNGISTEAEQPSIELTMQRYVGFAIREITLFYMHRGFFARALEENPSDPLGNKYGSSVLAAYNSATSFVSLIKSLYSQHPVLTERMWFLFTHVFSCAIVLGSIAVKSKMALAPSALTHLEAARQLFEQVSHNPRAAKVLPILAKLQDRAYSTMAPQPPTDLGPRQPYLTSVKNEDTELSTLGGATRLVARKTSSSPSSPKSIASPASSCPPSSPNRQSSYPAVTPPISDLRTFAPHPDNSWQDFAHVRDFAPLSNYSPTSSLPLEQEFLPAFMQNPNVAQNPLAIPQYFYIGYQDVPSSILDGNSHTHDPGMSWQNFMEQFKA
jgi:hypothetical protein